MSVTTTTHANFRGEARDALAFDGSVFGGEVSIATGALAAEVSVPESCDQVDLRATLSWRPIQGQVIKGGT